MNNKFIVIVLLLLVLAVCKDQVYNKSSPLSDFSTVIVSGPIQATLVKSSKNQITVEASSQDLLEKVIFANKGNTLTVRLNGSINLNSSYEFIRVKISYIKLTGIEARDTALITTDYLGKVSKFTA
jgi:hypothetical protein